MPRATVRIIEIAEILGVSNAPTNSPARTGSPLRLPRTREGAWWSRCKVTVWANRWRREKPWR
jgi:hypothetical protein